jgi:hypothetical protein
MIQGKWENAYPINTRILREVSQASSPLGRGCSQRLGARERPANYPSGKASPPPPIHVVDTFAGAHLGTLGQLSSSLFGAKLKSRVTVHKTDYLDWLWEEFSDKYVRVISSEFLPEIDSYEPSMFLSEC